MTTKTRRHPRSPQSAQPLLLINIGQLLTLRSARPGLRRGWELQELGIIEDGALLCVAGEVLSVGKRREVLRHPWFGWNKKSKLTEFDCRRGVVLPGFVDSHTHPAFVSPRLLDFEKRISGATYEEIAQAGGGIRSSIDGVRRASKRALTEKIVAALRQMAEQGTTTVEAKSGYGLSTDSEIKSLEAIRDAGKLWRGTVVPTLLAAHVVPPEFVEARGKYIDLICNEIIPPVIERKLASFIDVFIERGAFTMEEAEKIFVLPAHLRPGRPAERAELMRLGFLGRRAHVCQLSSASLARLLELHPASLDHLDCVSDEDIRLLAKSDTVATLVPGANYFLGLEKYPPARKLIDAGVAVALATDYNPGTSPTPSMPFVLSLACTHMKMSPAEAITAGTYNGACALRLQDRKGSIEPGKDADLAIFDVKDYRELPYWFGVNRCAATVLGGEVFSHRAGE